MLQRTGPADPADSERIAALLRAFREALSKSLPFREDRALLDDLLGEAMPVLDSLWQGYVLGEGAQSAQHEGFALFRLLCRRAGLLGATPTACIGLPRAIDAALAAQGVALSAAQRDELSIVAAEGFCAGRDEHRERSLRAEAIAGQACLSLGPRCYLVPLGGSHHPEHLAARLEEIARELFHHEARAVLVDLRRLREAEEDSARALVSFLFSVLGLGVEIVVTGAAPRFAGWFERFGVASQGVLLREDFDDARQLALGLSGFELCPRGPLRVLFDRLRAPRTR